jgi:glutamyl-tRNA synthetase
MGGKIRTRFAPSPTGDLHIGGLRTALFAYALAKHDGGDFLLRIEDTDKKREIPGGRQKIQDILKTFGLNWDESVYIQSKRLDLYKKTAEKLVKDGNAYEDDGAIRIKIPKDQTVSYHDFVLDKDITWGTGTLKELVLLKSDGYPTYHLAVVVDDHDMGITHVLRGHDWLPSTPLHILIYKFLGYEMPQIGHLTDILDPEGGKLSKRKGSTSCEKLVSEGYLPEAILNFVMLLGWAPKDNRELFNLQDFVSAFDKNGFQKANPIFNREKLDWFNGYYIRQKTDEELFLLLKPFLPIKADEKRVEEIIPLIRNRIKELSDFENIAGFFFERKNTNTLLFGKNSIDHLTSAADALTKVKKWNKVDIDKTLKEVVEKEGFNTGDFFMDLRISITGSKFTPPISDSIAILGKEETLRRLEENVG